MKLRAGLRALAAVVAGAILVLVGALSGIVFLVRQHCGADFGYYDCETPTATNQRNPADRNRDDGGVLSDLH
jgi:hypothetical protein